MPRCWCKTALAAVVDASTMLVDDALGMWRAHLPAGERRNWRLDIGVGNLATVSAFSGRGRQSTESSLVHL